MAGSENKKLVLNSTFDEMNQLEPFVKELQEWAGFTEDDFARIMLTLSEAVNNAITHGNRENPDKQVVINTNYDKDSSTITISVEDEGEGFNPDKIPDPLKKENLLNEGGRGVYLIEQYADEIEFTKNGTQIVITFHLAK